MKNADGRAALRCWPVDVSIAGCRYRIGGRPAIDWLLKVSSENWLGIVPGMVDGDDLEYAIEQGDVDQVDLVDAGRKAVALASGMPWWAACRLAKVSISDVELAGALILAGVNAGVVSLGGYLAAVYRLLVADLDKKKRASLDADITRIPNGVQSRQVYDPALASAQFEQMYKAQSVG